MGFWGFIVHDLVRVHDQVVHLLGHGDGLVVLVGVAGLAHVVAVLDVGDEEVRVDGVDDL